MNKPTYKADTGRNRAFSDAMQDMTTDIHQQLGTIINEVLEDFLCYYEPITYDAEFEAVEFEPYDGFIPFTDGGFHTLVIYPASVDPSHRPAVFDEYMQTLTTFCERDFYYEQCGEYPETDEELREYFDKLMDKDTGLEEDMEEYWDYENEYFAEACPGLEIKLLYYSKENSRNEKDHDAICISIQTNTDAPYYRDGHGLMLYEQWFSIDEHTPEVVASNLKTALSAL